MYSTVKLDIYREDGELFTIDDTVWRIPSDGLDGWHSDTVELQTSNLVNSDGSLIIGEHVGQVDRTITCEARDVSRDDTTRRAAESFFLPKMRYRVELTYMGKTRCCDGVQSGFMLSMGNIHRNMTLQWTITCPNPYFYAKDDVKSTSDPTVKGKFAFPYVSVEEAGSYADIYSRGFIIDSSNPPQLGTGLEKYRVAYIDYDGDVPSAPRFVAKSYIATNKMTIQRLVFMDNTWVSSSMLLELYIPDIAKYDQITVDLSKSPMSVSTLYHNDTTVSTVDSYTLLTSGKYLNRGLSAYAVKFGGLNDATNNSVSFDVYAKRLYTGV